MRLVPILHRLCWKECRQGWLLLALGLLLPALAVNLQHLKLLAWTVPEITLFVLLLGISVWASTLAADARGRQSYAAVHFPQHPALATLLTFVLQGSAAALIGILFGAARMQIGHLHDITNYPLWAMYYVASTFAVSFIMASALSPWSGMVLGILWMLGNMQTFSALIDSVRNYPGTEPGLAMLQMHWVLIVSVVLMLMLSFMLRLSFTRRRLLACVLLGAAMLSRPLCWIREGIFQTTHKPDNPWVELTFADGSLAVEHDGPDLQFIDYRRQHTVTRHFDGVIQPIGLVGHAVILAQQRKGEHRITLSRWSSDTNTVEPFASFSARPDGLVPSILNKPVASLSRDGHYGIILIRSPYWDDDDYLGFDIWKIDLQLRKVTLLTPAWSRWIAEISWHGDDALISNSDSIFSISMTSGQITPLSLPTPREGKS